MKLLTITVPCYNSQSYMRKCLDSLIVGGEDVEIIIVNDGSKDDTGKIADEYAKKYPTIVKVVHQENGGHGEGINQGIKNATGKYFKVVDSDDWLDESFSEVLAELKKCDEQGGVDLFITNYIYTHDDPKKDRFADFSRTLPEKRIFTWEETKFFDLRQYFTIHNSTFRTQVVKDSGLVCPKHCFYEDNYYVYTPLAYVEKMYYVNVNLYHYYIGREGQSMARNTLAKRYLQQMKVSTLIFKEHDLGEIEKTNKKMYKYMMHEQRIMFSAVICAARLNVSLTKSKQGETDLKNMWADLKAHDAKYYRRLKYSYLLLELIPTPVGRYLAIFFYDLAGRIMQLN